MGDYGAEKYPDIPRAQVVLRNYNFVQIARTLTEQWNIDATTQVSSFRDGTSRIRFKVLYNPQEIDLT